MLHKLIEQKLAGRGPVCAAVIGAGDFGAVIAAQQGEIQGLTVPIVADLDVCAAKNALLKAGFPETAVCYSDSAARAGALIESGNYVYTDCPEIIMDIPAVEIVCEGTGVPEAGARHCKLAIEHQKHVAAINKEVDSAIGPFLRRMAQEYGVVYTPVQGDQPGLLLALVSWAKMNGFSVVSAGKARDVEFILDEKKRTVSVSWEGITGQEWEVAAISEEDMAFFMPIPPGRGEEYLKKRASLLEKLPPVGDFDLCELTIIANHTGLSPAAPRGANGYLRITEVPQVYCEKEHGGIYCRKGMLDSFGCLRSCQEAGMGGGVYVVVKSENPYVMERLGQTDIVNMDRSAALLYRPFHLCGMEIAETLLSAVLLGIGYDEESYLPRYDLIKMAARDIQAGEVFGGDHDDKLSGMIVPAVAYAADAAVPGHLLDGNHALTDIPKGTVITYAQVQEPQGSLLWQFRKRQEAVFGYLY